LIQEASRQKWNFPSGRPSTIDEKSKCSSAVCGALSLFAAGVLAGDADFEGHLFLLWHQTTRADVFFLRLWYIEEVRPRSLRVHRDSPVALTSSG